MNLFKKVPVLLLAFALLAGCQNGTSLLSTEGTVSVSLKNADSRLLMPGTSLDIDSYTLRFERTGLEPQSYTLEGTSGTWSLDAGSYTLTVDGLNSDNLAIARGSAPVTVVAGSTASVVVSLLPLTGDGVVVLEAKVEGLNLTAPSILGQVTTPGNPNPIPLVFNKVNDLYKAQANLPAGSYQLSTELKVSSTTLSTGIETLLILAGATTYGGVSYHKNADGGILTNINLNPPVVTIDDPDIILKTTAPTISFDPTGPAFKQNDGAKFILAGADVGATVYYTLDKTNPTTSSLSYGGSPLSLPTGATGTFEVRAMAVKTGYLNSDVTTLSYTVSPVDLTVPDTLGALYTPTATTFRIWSPDSTDVKVVVGGVTYNMAKRSSALSDYPDWQNIYEFKLDGDQKLKTYTFKIGGVSVQDPYGRMIQPGTTNNVIVDMSSTATQPTGGWATRPALVNREDSILYEVHVRDFTVDASSGVDPAKRGKFLGMVQPGTTSGTVKTGLDHLKDLGVTHVQLLPFYDYGSPAYNWGYDPVNYNVPEEQYSQVPTDPEGRVKEVRDMVSSFHANGIRVVMDVVYNHTFTKSVLENITAKYYTTGDLSGCGNSLNTGVAMVSRMIRDSLEYWIDQYQIDGYRFDLIGIFHYDEVRKWGEYLNAKFPDRNILLYGEPWNGYKTDAEEAQKVRLGKAPALAGARIGLFNSKYREDIKGNNDGIVRAYMFNSPISWWGAIAAGSRGSLMAVKSTNVLANDWDSMFAYDPEQSINYISAHDNFGLWDKIYLSLSTNVVQADNKSGKEHQVLALTPPTATTLEYGERVAKFGMGMILTSQGIPFMHAGDEFLRTKTADQNISSATAWQYGTHGTHNTYNAPDSFNSIKWGRKTTYVGMYNYHRDLVALRKAHPGLRLTTWDEIKSRVKTELNAGANNAGSINTVHNASLPDKVVVNYIDENNAVGDGYELIVVFNPGNNFNLTLPAGTWKKVFDVGGAVSKTDTLCEGTAVTVFAKQ